MTFVTVPVYFERRFYSARNIFLFSRTYNETNLWNKNIAGIFIFVIILDNIQKMQFVKTNNWLCEQQREFFSLFLSAWNVFLLEKNARHSLRINSQHFLRLWNTTFGQGTSWKTKQKSYQTLKYLTNLIWIQSQYILCNWNRFSGEITCENFSLEKKS